MARNNPEARQIVGPDRIGVEPFDVGYGAGYDVFEESPYDLECELVEDAGTFRAHAPIEADRPNRVAFVDGTMRTDARLTRTEAGGETVGGLAGCWAAGAVLSTAGLPLSIGRVTLGRATIFGGGQAVRLPAQNDGWCWEAFAVEERDPRAVRRCLQRCMRRSEGHIAEELCSEGWVTIVDGPLHSIRPSRGIPIVGYVKTHHRRMLAEDDWTRVPELTLGERSGLFAIGDDVYGSYLRIGDGGPWAGPWAGIVRIEVPSGAGREEAIEVLGRAAALLPPYASVPHRDARAPVNLTPVSGLERHLRRLQGNPRLALRAVREAVVALNTVGEVAGG